MRILTVLDTMNSQVFGESDTTKIDEGLGQKRWQKYELIVADIKTKPIQVRGPMTRSRAKQIKEDMENLVSQASQKGESVKGPQHNRELVLLIQVTQDCWDVLSSCFCRFFKALSLVY